MREKMTRETTWTAAVFAASLLILGWNAGAPGFATAYVDPIALMQAQDEAVYASSSFFMAAHGDWVTPRYLGRYALYKPPLDYWLSAICIKILGRTALAIRIPSILAGAATVALIFWTLRASMPLAPSLAAAILLLSSHVFFVLSRTGLMDALLTFETAVAMCVLVLDPRLQSRRALAIFGCASGAAIMTKALAGLFPLFGLGLFCLISRERPRITRLAQAILITAIVTLPWHLWQLHAHPRWFWNEYVMTESLEQGNAAPIQTTQETQIGYYAKRLALLDPVLLIASLAGALAAAVRAKRNRTIRRNCLTPTAPDQAGSIPIEPGLKSNPLIGEHPRASAAEYQQPGRAAISFLLVVLACALAFRYRNTSYLMPLYPAMAMLAAGAISTLNARFAKFALALAVAVFIAKAALPDELWGLPFYPESEAPSEAALDRYAALHRGNELILIQPEDHFYSSDLDLPRVRYVYLDPKADTQNSRNIPLDFRRLGISVTVDDFAHVADLTPTFAARLHDFDLDSTAPIATLILARNNAPIDALIAAHPEADFYTPREFASGVSHDLVRGTTARIFLLSREKIHRP
jgi:4-amino-4-deoxy-L-arabinose transferase-like glycosyltransferase